MATLALRAPVEETFTWLRGRLAEVVQEGLNHRELGPTLDPAGSASAIVAALQGGYVLARAAGTTEPSDQAVIGILLLLAQHRPLATTQGEPRHMRISRRPAAGVAAPFQWITGNA